MNTTDIITHDRSYRQARLKCHMMTLVHYLRISGAKRSSDALSASALPFVFPQHECAHLASYSHRRSPCQATPNTQVRFARHLKPYRAYGNVG